MTTKTESARKRTTDVAGTCGWAVSFVWGPGTGLWGCRELQPAYKRSQAKGAFIIGWLR